MGFPEDLPKWMSDSLERLEYSTSFIGKNLQSKVVLDLGCSAGHQTVFLGKFWEPSLIVGVDNFGTEGGGPHCKREFINNVQSSGCKNVSLGISDAFSLPFQTSSIDAIVCSNALHHFFVMKKDLRQLDHAALQNMALLLQEWVRVLKPEGILLIKECRRYSFLRLLAKYGILKAARRIDFTTKQEPAAWCHLLNNGGFMVEAVEYYIPYRLRFLKPILNNWLLSFWVSMSYDICASVSKSSF